MLKHRLTLCFVNISKKYWDKNHLVRYIFDMWKAKAIKKANTESDID